MYIYFSKSINFSDSFGLSVPEITSKSNIFNYFCRSCWNLGDVRRSRVTLTLSL